MTHLRFIFGLVLGILLLRLMIDADARQWVNVLISAGLILVTMAIWKAVETFNRDLDDTITTTRRSTGEELW